MQADTAKSYLSVKPEQRRRGLVTYTFQRSRQHTNTLDALTLSGAQYRLTSLKQERQEIESIGNFGISSFRDALTTKLTANSRFLYLQQIDQTVSTLESLRASNDDKSVESKSSKAEQRCEELIEAEIAQRGARIGSATDGDVREENGNAEDAHAGDGAGRLARVSDATAVVPRVAHSAGGNARLRAAGTPVAGDRAEQ